MKKQTEKIKRHGVVYLCVFLVVILTGGYVWGIILTNRYYNQITVTREELLVQVERERRVRDTTGILASFKQERDSVTRFFKTPDDVISIIEDIEGFGQSVGAPVSVVQVQVSGEDPQTREGTFIMSIVSEGTWKEVTHLLSLLDSLPYHAQVTQVTLGVSESETKKVSWIVRASLSIALKK